MPPSKSQNPVEQKENGAEPISISTLLQQFKSPPLEYGPIDCWWWEAGPLGQPRMSWQLEEMKEKGVAGTWFYPRFVSEEPLSSAPPYWTEEWWDFTRFSLEEHQRLGLRAWFSDWTAHQFFQNRVREEREKNPALTGRRLVIREQEASAEGPIRIEIPTEEEILHAAAYKKEEGGLDYVSQQVLRDAVRENRLTWEAPEAGWLVTVVTSQPHDLDYLNRVVVNRWLEISLGVYEEKLPDFVGATLKAYGPDEMYVLNGNILYSPALIERFQAEKGYDPFPYLAGLFHDIGPPTDQIRGDYYEVMVSLLEENFYQPIAQWLHERGMQYTTIATWGRQNMLEQTYHYGDFFKMMRWFDVPGNEDPGLHEVGERRFIDSKLSSSIAHLYQKERVAVCAYWGSGWGATQEQNLAWTHENYAYGINLYNCHGVLYSTLGGWYEWVPPAVHFRQPYWAYWRHFTDYVRRLSYLLSQGTHQADVALLYPLTTIHAHWSGGQGFDDAAQEAATATFDLARLIYRSGLDFDFIDDPSLRRAEVHEGKLIVSGMEFRVVVLPPMTTIRTETLQKIKEFYDGGGTVVAFRRLPQASPEKGRDDPNLRALLKYVFGIASGENVAGLVQQENQQGGKAFFLPDEALRVPEIISNAIVADVVASEKEIYHTHQKIGDGDLYFLFNAKPNQRRVSLTFRVDGEPEVWDAFTGESQPVYRFERQGETTQVRLDMEPYEGILLVFTPPHLRPEVIEDNLTMITMMEPSPEGIEIQGLVDGGGQKKIRVAHGGREHTVAVHIDGPPEPIRLDDLWDFRLEPTLDNRWGDFRYPPSEEVIGAEARRFRYMEEEGQPGTELGWQEREFNAAQWPEVTYSYGPYWWTIGPFEEGTEPQEILQKAQKGEIDIDARYEVAGKSFQWQRYSFSQKFGYEGPGVHSEWGGLCGVSDKFLVFDAADEDKKVTRCLFTSVYSPEAEDFLFNFGGGAEFPRQAWINGEPVLSVSSAESEAQKTVHLHQGWNSVFLKLVQPQGERIETFAVFWEPSAPPSLDPYVPLLRWFAEPQKLLFDITPEKESRMGWYRFPAPPGLRSMRLNLQARNVTAWIDGQPAPVEDGRITLESLREGVSQVALRVEQEPGCYAGAAFPAPVAFECEEGKIPLGDWCGYGLETYSGGAVYTRVVRLEKDHLKGRVGLDLGAVSTTAEVHVNGQGAGVRMAQPFRFDITQLVQEGENQIHVKVVNTLANHISTYPTHYVYEGQTVSGLLGPVQIQFLSPATLMAGPTSGVEE